MRIDSDVVLVQRKGHSCKGKDWDQFILRQQEMIQEYGTRGWRLNTAAAISQGFERRTTFQGVLLYFTREEQE